jgi:cyanate permease
LTTDVWLSYTPAQRYIVIYIVINRIMIEQDKSYRMPWAVLASAWLLAFAMFAPMFAIPPIAHILKEELVLTYTQTSLLFNSPIMMIVALAIPAGIFADRIGVRKATGIGIILIAVGALLRGTATNTASLLAFTFIYGAGVGWCYPNLAKLISIWVPQQRAGTAMGILSTGMLTGGALAVAITVPFIFPITGTLQGVFFFWSIVPIVAAIIWWVIVKEPPHYRIQPQIGHSSNSILRQIVQNKHLWTLTALLFLHNTFFYNWSGWAPTLMMLKGATASFAGLLTSITLWVGIPTAFLMPLLAYRLGLRKPAIVLAIAAFAAITVNLDMSWLIVVVMGIAFFTQFPTILALPVELVPKEQVGIASGLMLSIGYIGGIIGPIVGGRILDFTHSLDLSLIVLGAVSATMIGVAFKLPETGRKTHVLE